MIMPSLNGPTVLVTGGGGFVGQRLLARLQQMAAMECHATRLEGRGLEFVEDCHWHQLDITDSQAAGDLVASVKPDVIFHLAAQSHVPTSFAQPQLTWDVNLQGTLNLLNAAANAVPQAISINVAASEIYGRSIQGGATLDETTPWLPLTPDAASKAAADLAA